MKNFITLITVTLWMISFGQKEHTIQLEWQSTPLLFSEDIRINIPHFQSEYFDYELGSEQIFFHYSIPTPTETDFIIDQIVYQTITKEELGRLSEEKLPRNINKKTTWSNSRNQRYLFLEFSPIIKDENN